MLTDFGAAIMTTVVTACAKKMIGLRRAFCRGLIFIGKQTNCKLVDNIVYSIVVSVVCSSQFLDDVHDFLPAGFKVYSDARKRTLKNKKETRAHLKRARPYLIHV